MSYSDSPQDAPSLPPSWMEQLIGDIGDPNARIVSLEQNFAQEVQSLQLAITVTDQNIQKLNQRIATMEADQKDSINAAVAAAIDINLEGINNSIVELSSGTYAVPSYGYIGTYAAPRACASLQAVGYGASAPCGHRRSPSEDDADLP